MKKLKDLYYPKSNRTFTTSSLDTDVAIIGGGYFVYSRKYGNNININGRRNSYQFSNVDDGNNDYRPPMQQQQDVQPENQTTVQKQPLLDLQQQDNV